MNTLLHTEDDFYLFETLYGSHESGLRHLERHLRRLARSARILGFSCDLKKLREEAFTQQAIIAPNAPQRVKISLERSGDVEIKFSPLETLDVGPVNVLLASSWGFTPFAAEKQLLLHKTSIRSEYDLGCRLSEKEGAFDMLFFNNRGELTEGGRTNVFLRLDGRWFTPPLLCGLLPGIMRTVLLEDLQFDAVERILYRKDLEAAEEILLCSSLRGAMSARLVNNTSPEFGARES